MFGVSLTISIKKISDIVIIIISDPVVMCVTLLCYDLTCPL